jgi:hypothetical protein
MTPSLIFYDLNRIVKKKLTGVLLNHGAFLLFTDTKEKGLEIFLL